MLTAASPAFPSAPMVSALISDLDLDFAPLAASSLATASVACVGQDEEGALVSIGAECVMFLKVCVVSKNHALGLFENATCSKLVFPPPRVDDSTDDVRVTLDDRQLWENKSVRVGERARRMNAHTSKFSDHTQLRR